MKKTLVSIVSIISAFVLASCNTSGVPFRPLRVGMDLRFPPFETVDSNNLPTGISTDIARGFGGFTTNIINTNFSTLIPSLESNEIDVIIASMSITPERQNQIDFSSPYFYFKIITLVNQDFATANNLTADSTTEDILAITSTKFAGIIGQVSVSIPEKLNRSVTKWDRLDLAISSVVQGTDDVLLMSASPVAKGFRENPSTTMIVWDPWVSSPIGMGFKKGNSALLAQANAFIATFSNQGGMYDQLREKYDAVILADLVRYGMDFFITE
jgi:polar amino acid transport system substrate-binding protein